MNNLTQAYQLLVLAAAENEDAGKILELVNKEFLSIQHISNGGLDDLYPALAEVFSSLPDAALVRAACKGDTEPLLKWHEGELEIQNEEHNYNYRAADLTLHKRSGGQCEIVFVTPTSGRVITIRTGADALVEVSCGFGEAGSICAATEVLRLLVHSGKTGEIKYYTSEGYVYEASTIVLGELDTLIARRKDSAENSNEYFNSKLNEVSGVLLNHAPDWMYEAKK